jgi:hypothetical protein
MRSKAGWKRRPTDESDAFAILGLRGTGEGGRRWGEGRGNDENLGVEMDGKSRYESQEGWQLARSRPGSSGWWSRLACSAWWVVVMKVAVR